MSAGAGAAPTGRTEGPRQLLEAGAAAAAADHGAWRAGGRTGRGRRRGDACQQDAHPLNHGQQHAAKHSRLAGRLEARAQLQEAACGRAQQGARAGRRHGRLGSAARCTVQASPPAARIPPAGLHPRDDTSAHAQRHIRRPAPHNAPVSAPAAMLFHGSSFLRTATSVQSKVLNRPPHTAKLPPMRGASRRIACARRARQDHVRVGAGRRGWQAQGRRSSNHDPKQSGQTTTRLPSGLFCARTSMPPTKRCPLGLFFMPLSRCQRPPPTTPIPNAPPTSSRILQPERA